MPVRMLEAKEVEAKIDKEKLNLKRAIDNRVSREEINHIEARKAVWERVMHHIKKGEIVTLDENDRICRHINVPRA